MKSSSAARLVLGLALLALPAATAPAGAADKVPVQVRVVTWQGKIMLDRKVRTGTTNVATSSKAGCLGGSPSDGSKRIPGATALGALYDAARSINSPKRLLLSDAFDFGLGVCGVGGAVASGEQWWELTYNHKPSSLGGEGTTLRRNDTVLWYLSKSYNETSPDELFLKAPERVRRNGSFRVRVLAYNDNGRARPVEGARLSLADSELTGVNGYTRLKVKKKTRIVARATGLIPSNRAVVRIRR
jgi:hypothetical protein